MSEEDSAKRLLLDENAFLRRKLEEIQSVVERFDWHEKELKRLADAVRTVYGGGVSSIQCAINDINELEAIRRQLQPEGRRCSNSYCVERLVEERDRYKAMVASALLDEVLAKLTRAEEPGR
jgi:hypothetical protein